MSVDTRAGERQEAVRGRVKERPEVEIDPSLPKTPSRFPLGLALATLVLLLGGLVGVLAYRETDTRMPDITAEQRENLAKVNNAQESFATLWETSQPANNWVACKQLDEIVRRPCKPTVNPAKLDFMTAFMALTSPDSPKTCSDAAVVFLKSRVDARCD